MGKRTIEISIDKFAELIRKASVYDIYAEYVKNSSYPSELEKTLFVKEVEGWSSQGEQ